MKVFISWSGERSRAVGDVLRRWFPSVLQAVRPYFSPDDVAKGTRWSAEIAKELEASRDGLSGICSKRYLHLLEDSLATEKCVPSLTIRFGMTCS